MLCIKFRGSAHTQKWTKYDATGSVDGFGGVRNGDRIRASGDVLFFHILKDPISVFGDRIHFELARLAAGTTVDILQGRKGVAIEDGRF